MKVRATWPEADQIPLLILEDCSQENPKEIKLLSGWMKKHKPDAILSTEGDIIAMLDKAGFKAHEDVGVAATSILATDTNAGMFDNPMEVRRTAVKTLVALIQRGELGIPEFRQNILVRGNWQDGSNLPPVPAE